MTNGACKESTTNDNIALTMFQHRHEIDLSLPIVLVREGGRSLRFRLDQPWHKLGGTPDRGMARLLGAESWWQRSVLCGLSSVKHSRESAHRIPELDLKDNLWVGCLCCHQDTRPHCLEVDAFGKM